MGFWGHTFEIRVPPFSKGGTGGILKEPQDTEVPPKIPLSPPVEKGDFKNPSTCLPRTMGHLIAQQLYY